MQPYIDKDAAEQSLGGLPFHAVYSERPGAMLAHYHGRFELMYFFVTKGCTYRCGATTHRIKSQTLLTVNPYEVHECASFGEGTKVLLLLVEPAMLGKHADLFFHNFIENDGEIDTIFLQMRDEIRGEKSPLALAALLYRLLERMCRLYARPRPSRLPLPPEKLTLVTDYIEENLSSPIHLADCATLLYVSEGRFYHLFKQATGLSPTEYIEKRRIARACDLLTGSSLPITEIALSTGFCDGAYFAKRFRAHMNKSPRVFRADFLFESKKGEI